MANESGAVAQASGSGGCYTRCFEWLISEELVHAKGVA